MSEEKTVRALRESHQPLKNEITKGYPVSQQVDLANLKPPSNLGSAAVTPQNSNQSAPAPAKTNK
ncbi:MAG: hypothetical protein LAO21_08365 [Acidobacteriia bacterium]|nr:hypothetical protein [Terriglobia bacterium]